MRDILWYSPAGTEMSDEHWNAGFVRCLGLYLDGRMNGEVDPFGEPIVGESILLLLNAHFEGLPFTLPEPAAGARWTPLIDTHLLPACEEPLPAGAEYNLVARSLAVLKLDASPVTTESPAHGRHVATDLVVTASLTASEMPRPEVARGVRRPDGPPTSVQLR